MPLTPPPLKVKYKHIDKSYIMEWQSGVGWVPITHHVELIFMKSRITEITRNVKLTFTDWHIKFLPV